jgi:DNA helicase-2/ATP-dependent DNA helicase PcrA
MKTAGECTVEIGPPGTGKTTKLIRHLCDELERGTPPERIAFVTFTRAACQEALDRVESDIGLRRDSMPWIRTIHSTAYKLLGVKRGQIMAGAQWREFAKKYGYNLTDFHFAEDGTLVEPPRRTEDDEYRYLSQWARNRRVPLSVAIARSRRPVSARQAELLDERARAYKTANSLLDFTDLLELSIGEIRRPDVDVAFIDEAQDLSPLQIAIVEQWFAPCRRVYVAGDDDQAIYGFQGAEPDWLLSLCEEHGCEVLEQSHRVPRTVHEIAERIIGRNRHRVPKAYRPRAEEGSVERLTLADILRTLESDTDTLVLARNRMFLTAPARALFDRRVPFFVEGAGGVNPYGKQGCFDAVVAATDPGRCSARPSLLRAESRVRSAAARREGEGRARGRCALGVSAS